MDVHVAQCEYHVLYIALNFLFLQHFQLLMQTFVLARFEPSLVFVSQVAAQALVHCMCTTVTCTSSHNTCTVHVHVHVHVYCHVSIIPSYNVYLYMYFLQDEVSRWYLSNRHSE